MRGLFLALLLFVTGCSSTKSALYETGEWLVIGGVLAGGASLGAGSVHAPLADDPEKTAIPYYVAVGTAGAVMVAGAACMLLDKVIE